MAEATIHGIEVQVSANAGEATKELKRLADTLSRLKSAGGNLGLSKANSEIKNLRSASAKTTSALSKLGAALKRIAMYRLLRSAIRAITDAFKEGLKNAYEFSKLTGDRAGLANALDTLATKSLTMKNQLGAAFGQLLVAITPVVVQIINLVTKLAEALSRLIAILGGSDTYLKAKDVWTEWGDAAQTAGGQAKKALKYLAPFDELNVLPDPKSGGGGGGSGTNYGDMFEYANVGDGLGIGDALIEWYNGIADFFENTNWKELANTAWSRLKEAFSDNGKATEVVEALFEALGAVTGGTLNFVVSFSLAIADDIFKAVKQSIHDYNGDGRISLKEILDSLVISAAVGHQAVKDWVKEHIADPFMDGFAKAIGMSGKEELHDAIVNLGIDIRNWFVREVVNPVIEEWNNWVDTMPQWMQDRIANLFGVDSLKIPMIAEIDHVDTAGLTASQKIISGITAGLTAVNKNDLTTDQKTIKTTSKFTWSDDNLSDYKKTIKTTSQYTWVKDNLSENKKTIKTTSKWWWTDDKLSNNQKTFKTTSKWWWTDDQLSGNQKTFKTTSKWWYTSDELSNNQKTFKTTSKWWYVADGLTENQKTISSTAYIADYRVDDDLKYCGYMSVSAYLNIKGQTNTPTVTVNAQYTNQEKAMGGAYYGGAWHDIPQYAGGTLRAGSMFIAGEAGPEIVGHIGGRTEVLNRSQLASTMYAAVRSAMASSAFRISNAPAASSAGEGSSEDVLYRAFRRALDETDFSGDIDLDGDTVYRAMVRRNRQNTRLTGVNAMA